MRSVMGHGPAKYYSGISSLLPSLMRVKADSHLLEFDLRLFPVSLVAVNSMSSVICTTTGTRKRCITIAGNAIRISKPKKNCTIILATQSYTTCAVYVRI